MLIYEVNLRVEEAVARAFKRWLHAHIEAMLRLDGFEAATWYRLEEPPEGHRAWTIHYHLADRDALDAYFAEHAAAMRADGQAHFGGRFEADRRILEVWSEYAAPPSASKPSID